MDINKLSDDKKETKSDNLTVPEQKIKKSSSPTQLSPVAPIEVLTITEKLEKFETFGRVTKEDDGKIIKDENEEVISVERSTYTKLI